MTNLDFLSGGAGMVWFYFLIVAGIFWGWGIIIHHMLKEFTEG